MNRTVVSPAHDRRDGDSAVEDTGWVDAGECQCGQEPAVRLTPYRDPPRIDEMQGVAEVSGGIRLDIGSI